MLPIYVTYSWSWSLQLINVQFVFMLPISVSLCVSLFLDDPRRGGVVISRRRKPWCRWMRRWRRMNRRRRWRRRLRVVTACTVLITIIASALLGRPEGATSETRSGPTLTLSGGCKLHPLLLLPLVAEPDPDDVLFEVELLCDGRDLLARRPRLHSEVGLQRPLLRRRYRGSLSLLFTCCFPYH